MSLDGLRVLVVRPRLTDGPGADTFVEQLTLAGAESLHYPVMTLERFNTGTEAERIKRDVLNLAHFDTAIFVSRPAARLGVEWIDRYWPQLPINTQFYAVGKSTASVLTEYGIDVRSPDSEMTSEGLLALPELQQLQHRKVLLFRGQGGRDYLAKTLQARGADVHHAELYRRTCCTRYQNEICSALQSGVDAVVVHSGELLQALLTNIERVNSNFPLLSTLKAAPVLVPSERVASLVREAGFQRVVVAENALPQSMVSALHGWYINRH